MSSNKFAGPFHQSQIAKYNTCPRKFYYSEILGIERETKPPKMLFGTAAHELLKTLHESRQVPNLNEIRLQVGISETMEETKVWWTSRDAEIDAWAEDMSAMLHNYWAKPFNREAEVIVSEAEFTVKIGSFEFAGRIDQVRRYEDKVLLIDYKTGEGHIDDTILELDYQPSIYAWALMHGKIAGLDGNLTPDQVGFYRLHDHLPYKKSGKTKNGSYTKGDERGPGLHLTTRTAADFEAMTADLGIICRSIVGPHYDARTNRLASGGAFGRTPNIANCQSCAYRAECVAERRHKTLTEKTEKELSDILVEEDFAI